MMKIFLSFMFVYNIFLGIISQNSKLTFQLKLSDNILT